MNVTRTNEERALSDARVRVSLWRGPFGNGRI